MTTKIIQTALLSLALVAGSAGLASAQGTAPAGSPNAGPGGNSATGSGAAPSGK